MNNQPWLTAKEAAARLGVRTSTIYAYASRGLLGAAARGPGKKARYPRDLVETLKKKADARAGHGAVAAAALRWGEPVLDSSITELTVRGPVYRGRRAIDLVGEPFERVAELLWGSPPLDWSGPVARSAVRSRQPSVNALVEAVLGLPAAHSRQAWVRSFACAAGPHFALAARQPTIAEAVGASLLGRRVSPAGRALLNASLVLLADHELNASTFAARVAASAGAPVPSCLISALGAAAGTRHAAACDLAEDFWRATLAARRFVPGEEPPPGFEAGAYPQGDPRAEQLLRLLRPRWSASMRARVEGILRAVDEATGQLPAVDTALVLVCLHLRLPPGSATMLFVVGRLAGWLAHVEEQQADRSFIRPRARFSPRPEGEYAPPR